LASLPVVIDLVAEVAPLEGLYPFAKIILVLEISTVEYGKITFKLGDAFQRNNINLGLRKRGIYIGGGTLGEGLE